jgi:protoporphyrinogen oxidase
MRLRLRMTQRTAIIGAGPAGLTAAYVLSKHSKAVDVYESSNAVGGLSRSLHLWGQTVDVGPHRFFSTDHRVNELWLEVVGRDYVMVDRLTRILYRGRLYRYPLEPYDALANLGLYEAARCVASYAREKLRMRRTVDDFESWVVSRFGRRLFETFFRAYSEKLWGLSCDELDIDFAAQRIRKFSLGAALFGAFKAKDDSHRTLVDRFAYPIQGTGMVYERMAKAVSERGCNVYLSAPVRRVIITRGRVVGLELRSGEFRECNSVISTMPLTALVSQLPDPPNPVRHAVRNLTFRNTILVYLEVASDSVCRDNWVYIQDRNLRTGRITNFRNWAPHLCGDQSSSILALEFWCDGDDAIWSQSDDDLINLAKRELMATKLAENEALIVNATTLRVPRSYPVYRKGYRQLLEPIRDYLKKIKGLQAIGRYGSFKYNNQDHSILMGLLAAENVTGADHDLWGVNADYETYQERSYITDTGLERSDAPSIVTPAAASLVHTTVPPGRGNG